MAETSVEIAVEASQSTGAISTAASHLEDFKKSVASAGESAAEGSQKLGALDEAAKSLEGALGSLVTGAAIGAFFKEAVAESLKEAEALRQVRFNVESLNLSWGRAKEVVDDYSASRQAQTRFDDTVTLEVLSKMQRATGSLEQAMKATSLAQDIAAASGKDLSETTSIVNGLLTGQERAVKQAQKEFAAYVGSADTTADVLKKLEEGFYGSATAEQSFTKSLNQSKAFLADFQQRVGDGVVPVMNVLLKAVAFVAKGYEELGVSIAGFAAAAFQSISGLARATKAIFSGNFGEIAEIWRETKDSLAVIAEESGAEVAAIEARFHGEAKARIEDRVVLVAKASEEEVNKRAKAAADAAAKEKEAKAKAEADAKKFEEERKKNFASTLTFISTLSTSKNAELRAIGKAGALASAYINTAEAVTKALASAPPPFNFALAAAVGAAGAAQVATIAGVELEEGGLVRGSQSGTQATIGEKGKDEAVLPLTNSGAMRSIGEAIASAGGAGSGGEVFNIYLTVNAAVPEWRAIIDRLTEEAENGTPEIARLSRRLADLAELNQGRA